MKSGKLYIPCIEQGNYWKAIRQYNEFNKVLKKNGYCIYELWE